jgi:hypothetical protein
MTETIKLQVRAEAFNALNHTNLGTPNRFVNTPQFGTITEAATPGPEIQLGVRLSFEWLPHSWTQSVQGAVATWSNGESQKSLRNIASDY